MAIRIPILTSFDPKGLKQANASFAKLQSSIGSLGRNVAVAGAALGVIGVGLGKSVNQASNLEESLNAVNVAFGRSATGIIEFGKTAATTLGVSQVDFNNAAVRFSAFADRIVGSGNNASGFIAEIATRASDFASVFNIDVAEALGVFQSGLAGEAEPLKRFGINLLETEVKAFAVRTEMIKQGETLTEQQKVLARYGLIMESTAKTAGDFANTSDGLANGMRILEAQIMDTQAEIGNQLLPVIAEVIPVIREMATELGEKLVEAVKQIDFKALITSVTDFTGFLITNLETITKVIVGLFALNTAYKLMVVFAGLATVATDLYKWSVAQATAGIGLKTIAVNLLTSALKLLPFVAVVGGIASIITELVKATDTFNTFRDQLDKGSVSMKDFDKDLGAVAATFLTFDIKGNPFLQLLQDGITLALQLTGALNKIPGNVTTTYTLIRQTAGEVASSFGGSAFDATNAQFQAGRITPTPTPTGGGSSAKTSNPLQELFADPARNIRADKQAVKLEGAGLSKEIAKWAVSVAKPVAVARKILGRIDRNGATAIANVTRQYQNSSEGRAAAASAAAQAESDGYAAAEAIRAAEKAALEERERVYKSFADSVKSTFAGIKNSILGAFDLTQLGGSTNAITRNMDKLLVRLRAFASNVSKLSGMGLNPALLQQVITAGPLAGARLAESLVMGGAGALSAINAGFSEFGALSSQIAQTGTESLFNREAQQTVYNINVDGGVGSGATIGKAIVDAIKSYERTSGAVWQGA
jgi:hypothetical protein